MSVQCHRCFGTGKVSQVRRGELIGVTCTECDGRGSHEPILICWCHTDAPCPVDHSEPDPMRIE